MEENFENTNRIVNGYWYTFEYHNKSESVPGYDRFPFVYCIGPSTKNLNCFVGLNLHQLPLKARIEFIIRFDKFTRFREEDIRYVYTAEELIQNFGAGLGIQGAIRYYNKKNIMNPYRILNKAVPLYIEYDGDIIMKDPGTVMNKYFLELGENNSTNRSN